MLRKKGARVLAISISRDLIETTNRRYRTPRGPRNARRLEFEVLEPESRRQLEQSLSTVSAVVCAAPAAVQVLRKSFWKEHQTIRALVDFNSAEPFGVEPSPDGAATCSILLDAFEIARQKMRLHRACVARLFEHAGLILDTDEVFDIARTLLQGGPVLDCVASDE
jgi:hypothetical protein